MTKIPWTHRPGTKGESWNVVAGCTKESEGCANCYALAMSWRLMHNPTAPDRYKGTVEKINGRPEWTGKVNCDEEALGLPMGWKAPRTIFVGSMADLFHYRVPQDFQGRVLKTAALPFHNHHTFIFCTKRPAALNRVLHWLSWDYRGVWRVVMRPNVWGLVSCENQEAYERRVRDMSKAMLSVRGLSFEPLLGPIALEPRWKAHWYEYLRQFHWAIIGCESGPHRRLGDFHNVDAWHNGAAELAYKCQDRGMAVFVKQVPIEDGSLMGFRASADPDEWPEALRVQEWPG